MKANPYYLKDLDGGFYNKYPEFQVWEDGYKAGIKEAMAWGNDYCTGHSAIGYSGGNNRLRRECPRCWQSKLKEWGIE